VASRKEILEARLMGGALDELDREECSNATAERAFAILGDEGR